MLRGLPGKLTISVVPRTPATLRDSIQWRVCSRDSRRIASAMPGASRSITPWIASGVTSLGAIPVPPVVRIRAQPSSSDQCIRRRSIWPRSSVMTSRPASSRPRLPTNSASASPEVSSPSPAAFEVETVITAARPLIGGASAGVAGPVPASPAALFEQLDRLDPHAALQPLDHVVDGQGCDPAGGHRLHLDTGPPDHPDLGGDQDQALVRLDLDLEIGERERQRVRQGNQLAGALGGGDA